MGANHTFTLRLPIARQQALLDYLRANTSEGAAVESDWRANQLNSLVILVTPDLCIKRYWRGFYCVDIGPRSDNMDAHMLGDRCMIGAWDISVKHDLSGQVSMAFSCVTSEMSYLCNDSPSIRTWFTNLCAAVHATIGVYHCDNVYYEVFWWEHKACSLRISADVYNLGAESLGILEDFYPLAFDSWYNTIDP